MSDDNAAIVLRAPLIFCCLAVACSPNPEQAFSLELGSHAPAELLATCISQNYDSTFPRFFPAVGNDEDRTFRTYNGIEIIVADEGDRRKITVRSSTRLTENMLTYLQKCVSMSEAA